MTRIGLMERAKSVLDEHGWATCCYHGCFDIAARKHRLLMLKVLSNIDALQPASATNLKTISANMNAGVLVIGETTSRERLATGVIYERYELPTLSIETFEELIINDIVPALFRDKGGLYMEIEPSLLKAARKGAGMTQAELADAVGISKKTVYCHEHSRLRAPLAMVQKIETVLKKRIVHQPNMFKEVKKQATAPKDKLERMVNLALSGLGFKTEFVGQAPFDVFAREKALLLSDIEADMRAMVRRAPALKQFMETVRQPALMITEHSRDEEIFGIPVVEHDELLELGSPKELLRLARKGV
ncbi:MAG: helix-turn-helix domain-containing protein [Candidatus Aenigmatarchaeota archaeon]|nr:helix-turn-helix domain-containing protein [Candidatus Aenigmarchaeota archaeon]